MKHSFYIKKYRLKFRFYGRVRLVVMAREREENESRVKIVTALYLLK